MNKLIIIATALSTLYLTSCTETKQVDTTENVETVQTKSDELTKEEKVYISKKLEEFKELKSTLIDTDKSDGTRIRELNIKIDSIDDYPDWFSKNTREIRYIKLLAGFISDLGVGLASNNDDLIKIANDDFENLSVELTEMLK